MKKIFTLIAAAMISAASFAQGVYDVAGYDDGVVYDTPAAITSVPGVKVSLGPVQWKAKNGNGAEQIFVNGKGMTQRLEGQATNPTKDSMQPTEGAFIVAEPTIDGTLYMGCVINGGKAFWVTEDGVALNGIALTGKMDGDDYTGTIDAGSTLDSKLYGCATVPVKAGKKYYIFVAGSKIAFGGFELSTVSDNIEQVQATAAKVARKVATANGIQIVKGEKTFSVAGQEL